MKPVHILFLITLLLLISPLFSFSGAYLGVYLEDLTEQEKIRYAINHGVRVEFVIPESPAVDAGIINDDIIISIDGKDIKTHQQVMEIIKKANPGDKLPLVIISNRRKKELVVTLGDRERSRFPLYGLDETKTKQIGIKLQHLTDQMLEFFEVKHGVLVNEVLPSSPAEKAGMRAGDVIYRINDKDIAVINDLRLAILYVDVHDFVTVHYSRKGVSHQVKVQVYETDIINSIDPGNEIVFLSRDFSLSDLDRWFRSLVPDSTRKDLEKQLHRLQEEIDTIRQRVFSR